MRREHGGGERSASAAAGASVADMLLLGLGESSAAFCVCGENDLIRYVSASFRDASFPQFDGRPSDFVTAVTDAIEGGTGIRLASALPRDFA